MAPRWHHVAFDDVTPTPWKNGGGQTRQLLAWPTKSSEWIIRFSIADITQDGPFSAFEGTQRWFAVLSGGGVRLFGELDLNVGDPVYQFDGSLAPSCSLLGEAVRDYNLMLRNSSGRMTVTDAQSISQCPATVGAKWIGLFTVILYRYSLRIKSYYDLRHIMSSQVDGGLLTTTTTTTMNHHHHNNVVETLRPMSLMWTGDRMAEAMSAPSVWTFRSNGTSLATWMVLE
jgi:environmental stress-induced protein Ves